MAQYNIYAGLGGGFGGKDYKYTDDFTTEADAIEAAYECAIEEYQSYEGCNGILSEGDIAEENGLDLCDDEEEIQDMYQEEIESWIEYEAVLTDEDPDCPEI